MRTLEAVARSLLTASALNDEALRVTPDRSASARQFVSPLLFSSVPLSLSDL